MTHIFKIVKRMTVILFSIVALLVLFGFLYMQQPQFGKAPSGERLEKIKRSPHYKEGAFQNLSYTPTLTEGFSWGQLFYDFFFKKDPNNVPSADIPSVHTDLKNLSPDEDVLVWFGHSSYFMRVQGISFLVDPVFSGSVSPVPMSGKAFGGADIYGVDDMPEIDYLLISHDHYDHLDYETVVKLNSRVKHVVCGLGVGAHLEHWGYMSDRVFELDWNESADFGNGIKIHALPARHFSGRKLKRNNTLWASYLLELPDRKIFVGGDSGYDTHFKEIGNRFGPIDLAILENGQYNEAWRAIHSLPQETVEAAKDLKARSLMQVHNSKFSLGLHSWKEPLEEVFRLSAESPFLLLTPMIGEKVDLNDSAQVFTPWWNSVR